MKPRLSPLRDAAPRVAPDRTTFFDSAAGAALITVFIGGLFSTVIAGVIQWGAKNREFENEMVKAFGQHNQELLKARLVSERDTLVATLQLAGRTMSHAQSRVDISGEEFARREDPEQEKLNERQKQEVRAQFNAARAEWNIQNKASGYLLTYYFSNAAIRWRALSGSMSLLLNCADKTTDGNWSVTRCSAETARVEADVDLLLANLRPRTGEWLRKEDVARLRSILRD